MLTWYYFVIIGAVFNAFALVIEKLLLKTEHALAFSASYALMLAILSLVFIPFANFSLTLYQWGVLFIYSVTLALAYWMAARLFRHGSISSGAPLYNILPTVVTVVLAFIFLGETLSASRYGLIAIIVLTAFIILTLSNRHRDTKFVGHYNRVVILVALVVGINSAILKYALDNVNIYAFITVTSIMTAIILWAVGRERATNKFNEFNEVKKLLAPLAAMAFLVTVYRLLLYNAVPSAPISLVIPLNSTMAVLLNVLSGGVFFGESHIRRKLLLSAVMLIAAYFLIA